MYVTERGDKVFVIDGHVHLWDARQENRRNRFGQTFIDTFYGGQPKTFSRSATVTWR